MNRKLRMGMIGGGVGSFIGVVHRMAATLDGRCEVVCGAFSSTPERSRESGRALFLPDDRSYGTFEEMIEKEKKRPVGDRMDFVAVMTPNNLHFRASKLALESGFPVMSDKPVTYSYEEAVELAKIVEKTGLLFGLTHNYTGYPMVKEARDMARSGKLGTIRKVVVEYPQGWLAVGLEKSGNKQAEWRTDPVRSGKVNCMGDIGIHAENLCEYITGLKISKLCADLTSFGEGRVLEDDGNVLVRFENGARGILYASQISLGEENGLSIRVYGDTGSLEWHQLDPNTLIARWIGRPAEILRTGGSYLSRPSLAGTRIPSGHPEGFIEAFANLYNNYLRALECILDGKKLDPEYMDFPTVYDGIRGMAFIDTVVESNASSAKWTAFKK